MTESCVPHRKIGLLDRAIGKPPWKRLPHRRNQLDRATETWRPPLFKPVKTRSDHWLAAARRFLDLQAGSIWRDLRQLVPESRGVILDVGCGAQPYRSLVDPVASYRGIDYADAQRHFGYSMPDTTYYEGDRWPVSDASVDVVLSTETLEHVPDPPYSWPKHSVASSPAGSLILTVPFAARWHFIPHDYWRFTPSGLQRLSRVRRVHECGRVRAGKRPDRGMLQGDGIDSSLADAANRRTRQKASHYAPLAFPFFLS